MPSTGAYINQAQIDGFNNIWTVGRNLNKFNGTVLTSYDYLNSAVPANGPYYLDTRSISIDEDNTKWVGCSHIPTLPSALIFSVEGPNASTGESWTSLEITGENSFPVDVPTIYASPYGDEILAFISPLNGGSGTGPDGVYGVTGGELYVYNKILATWTEPAEDFVWPHIYDIKAKGILGSTYEYYLATPQGIYIIPPGTLKVSYFTGGLPYLEQANIWNSENTSLPSDTIYSLDFDENGHLWIGTDSGLAYWDGSKIYVWNSTILPGLLSDEIMVVQSRPNGHVFFTAGNPEKGEGTGFYYFNGDTLINYNSSNSVLPSNDVYSVLLVEEKSFNNGTTLYPNNIVLISGNNVGFFDYTIPHIYATSKFAGTTGWNFVDYTPTTEALVTDEAKLPKANKYTWAYPSWGTYQNSYLQYKHPGLDPRNLFLEADLKAIADGRAGEQNYWNLGEIPNFSEIQIAQSLQNSSWVNGITGGTGEVKITSASYIDEKYVFGGYSTDQSVYFGPKNNLEELVIANPNPTDSFYQPWSGQSFGFVSYYNESGQVQDVLPIRGLETKVYDVQTSVDDRSLYVLGTYKGYIEIGELIYSSTYPGAAGITGGPIGGPIGFSNIQTPGITGSPYSYPWIYDGTQVIPATGPFLPETSVIDEFKESIFLLEIEKNLGSESSYGGIDFGVTGGLESSFRVKDFRIFPGASSGYNPISTSVTIDTILYGPTLSLSVSDYGVEIVGTLEGGISTFKDGYNRNLDLPSTDEFIFSQWETAGSNYLKGGFWISLGTELELLKTEVTSGTGGNVIFNSIQKDQGTLTYLITGTSNSTSFDFIGSSLTGGSTGSNTPFYLISDYSPAAVSHNFIQTNSAPIDEFQGIDSSYFNGRYYWATFYSGTGSFGSNSISEEANYNGYSILTAEITPSQSQTQIYSNKVSPVDLNSTSLGIDDFEIGLEEQRFYSFFSNGGTASNNIYKVNPSGGLNGSIYIGGTGNIRLSLDPKDNLLAGGYRIGSTGPSSLPVDTYAQNNSFAALIPQYVPGTGIDLGNIISRAGSGAWTWADVSNSNGDLLVPMLSTVFFSNYASHIFGKQNNKWILKDAKSDSVILDVKSVPYFIYTFTDAGYYTIQNSVEDSFGNVYSITKPAFIRVVNQSVASASDPNPEFVNSVDYGYPPVMPGENNASFRLGVSLLAQQEEILKNSRQPFGSGLILPDDPNSTFRGN